MTPLQIKQQKFSKLSAVMQPEIQKRISISYDPRKSSATVTFDFPLSGVKDKQTSFRYKKIYESKDIEYNVSTTPVVELWPNIRSELWKNYYLLYANYRAPDKKIADNIYYVMPWAYGKELCKETSQDLIKNLFTVKLNDLPEALIITCISGGNSSEAGLVLLKKPDVVEPHANLSWKIGVDFGTSSTMIFYADNQNSPRPLNFSPHLYQITNS